LEALRADVLEDGDETFERWRPLIERPSFLPSARNLARYIALRRHELRELQLELMPWGLSSLGRCEARVLENLDAVISTSTHLDVPGSGPPAPPDAGEFFRGHDLLRRHSEAALGPTPPNVTMIRRIRLGEHITQSRCNRPGACERDVNLAPVRGRPQ
jgi:pyruvate kinase